MKLIDQYIFEVGEHLPEKQRADVEKELRSLIEDTLEERSINEGKPVDEEMVVDVLMQFGPPAKMASSYQPARYLIGPWLYPTFILVLKVVGSIIVVLGLIGMGVDASKGIQGYESIFEFILGSLGDFFQSLLAAFGNVVFIFAVLERFVPQGPEKEKEWDPRSLKPVLEPEKISRFEQIWLVFWSTLAILLFNFYPHLLRLTFLQEGRWNSVSFLSDTFFKYVPGLTVLWVLEIILSILLFTAGKWQLHTRWFKVGIKAFNIVLLVLIIAGPSIFQISSNGMPAFPGVLERLSDSLPLAYNGFRTFLAVLLVIEGIQLGKVLYHAVTGKPFRIKGL